MSILNQSMRPVASFIFDNSRDGAGDVKLCLFAGHYDVSEVGADSLTNPTRYDVRYTNNKVLKDAGYECDQVADDTSICSKGINGSTAVTITPVSKKTRYRDFLNFIKLAGLKITKMRITDLMGPNSTHEIFQQEMEISSSSIGAKSGSDFVQLAQHINPSNYLQTFIEVDLELQNLLLDETTLAFLKVPAGSKFQIDFTLAK